MSDINHKKSDVISHAKFPREGSRDVEATEYAGNIYKLRCKNCGWVWTVSWRPSMAKENEPSPK